MNCSLQSTEQHEPFKSTVTPIKPEDYRAGRPILMTIYV